MCTKIDEEPFLPVAGNYFTSYTHSIQSRFV